MRIVGSLFITLVIFATSCSAQDVVDGDRDALLAQPVANEIGVFADEAKIEHARAPLTDRPQDGLAAVREKAAAERLADRGGVFDGALFGVAHDAAPIRGSDEPLDRQRVAIRDAVRGDGKVDPAAD